MDIVPSHQEKRKRINNRILAAAILVLIGLNLITFRTECADKFRLYRFGLSNQTLYHPEFLEDGRYPDVLIREVIRDKKACFNADFRPYWTYAANIPPDQAVVNQEYFMDNSKYFFREYAGEYEIDPSLPRPEQVREAGLKDMAGKYFTELGSVNDMLRYVFAANDDRDDNWSDYYKTSYFMYMWYYHYLKSGIMGYAALDDLSGADEVVAVWDKGENLFLMSRDYYRDHLEELFQESHGDQ